MVTITATAALIFTINHFPYLRFLGSRLSPSVLSLSSALQVNTVSLTGWHRFTSAFCHSELLYVDVAQSGLIYCPRYLPSPGQEAITLRRNMLYKPIQDMTILESIVADLPISLSEFFVSESTSSAPTE